MLQEGIVRVGGASRAQRCSSVFFTDRGTPALLQRASRLLQGFSGVEVVVWEPRDYRHAVQAPGLVPFEVRVAETDLQILASSELADEAERLVRAVRADLELYLASHPRFAESFVPVPADETASPIVVAMAAAGAAAGVGPMAAVAGAVAEAVARGLAALSPDVIVENGGDLYLMGTGDRIVGLWAGEGGARGVGLRISGARQPVGVATSSGTIGPSVSLGRADTATVVAESGALADAVASAVGNRVRGLGDLEAALGVAKAVPGVLGAVVSIEGSVAAWGDIELVAVSGL